MTQDLIVSSLPNGLRIVLRELHTAPIVSTFMWYRVGSRNEGEGLTGVSHWVEHMLFKGSKRYPKGSIMQLVDRHGGEANAMTSRDFTAYYETLPSSQVELALDIESDRMTGALFDPAEIESERTVVIAEREGSENEPRYMLHEALVATAFQQHPYHHQVIGWKADLQAITRDELYAHYRRYYSPNNAILVMAGDFDADQMLSMIGDKFGALSAGELPAERIRTEPDQRGERRVLLHMAGGMPSVQVAYRTPAVSDPDYMPLVILNSVLTGGSAPFHGAGTLARSARLYRALVDTELASAVSSSYQDSLDPYLLILGAIPRKEHTPAEVEQALKQVVQRLREELISEAELHSAIRQTSAQLAYANERVRNQALSLGLLSIVDQPERLMNIMEELAAVTPESVQRAAQRYLVDDRCITGIFEPEV
ncbi:MAG: insulinase family protein [Chloroflexi bacterium]|nr:insulinase family protein [Chloroflexota bacterium]